MKCCVCHILLPHAAGVFFSRLTVPITYPWLKGKSCVSSAQDTSTFCGHGRLPSLAHSSPRVVTKLRVKFVALLAALREQIEEHKCSEHRSHLQWDVGSVVRCNTFDAPFLPGLHVCLVSPYRAASLFSVRTWTQHEDPRHFGVGVAAMWLCGFSSDLHWPVASCGKTLDLSTSLFHLEMKRRRFCCEASSRCLRG